MAGVLGVAHRRCNALSEARTEHSCCRPAAADPFTTRGRTTARARAEVGIAVDWRIEVGRVATAAAEEPTPYCTSRRARDPRREHHATLTASCTNSPRVQCQTARVAADRIVHKSERCLTRIYRVQGGIRRGRRAVGLEYHVAKPTTARLGTAPGDSPTPYLAIADTHGSCTSRRRRTRTGCNSNRSRARDSASAAARTYSVGRRTRSVASVER